MRVRMRVRCEMEMEMEGQQQWKEEVGVMGNILDSDNSGSSEDSGCLSSIRRRRTRTQRQRLVPRLSKS